MHHVSGISIELGLKDMIIFHCRPATLAASTAEATLAAPASDSTSRASPNRVASDSPSSMSNLATYSLPQRRPQQRWLDACIRDAVANLDEAPFLQASSLDPEPQLQRFAVDAAVGDAPQVCTPSARTVCA